jgi:two-component system, OmpR family, response regulator
VALPGLFWIEGGCMPCVLVVEDDEHISNMLRDLLQQNGYQPILAYSGTEALLRLEKARVDLALLDLMLPGKRGEEVLAEIRRKSDLPVIALTAVSDRASKISMLKSGADDYVTKPFDNDELLARMQALLRRAQNSGETKAAHKIGFKDIEIDPETYQVWVGNEVVPLSKHEFEILKLLVENPKRVFTKNNIYETVWGEEFLGDDNTINVHISRIRAKLAKANPHQEYIQTVWGIGFKMEA